MALSYYAPITDRQRSYLASLIRQRPGSLYETVDLDVLSSLDPPTCHPAI